MHSALRESLVTAAGRDDESIDIAQAEILEALSYYEAARPGVMDQSGRRQPRKPSETRKKLRAAEKGLSAFLDAFGSFDADARKLIGESMESSLGSFQLSRLPDFLDVLRKANEAAKALPQKEANFARSALACDIARVLRDVIGAKLSITGPSRGIRNGAHYTAVLQQTLALTNEYAADWETLARSGLRLLEEITDPEITGYPSNS